MRNIPDKKLRIIQNCVCSRPVIVLGSGASAAYGIAGMPQLAEFLIKNIEPSERNKEKWDQFKKLIIDGTDLENALHEVSISEDLEKEIVNKTRRLILGQDLDIFVDLTNKRVILPLSKLLKHLSQTANPNIKIVTTNYDRIAEYAIDNAYLEFTSGFSGYYKQYFNGFNYSRKHNPNMIELLKVHGSLDWFVDEDSNVIALPDVVNGDANLTPLMVTPGVRKYEHTHKEPFRSIITKSDQVFENSNSILCIGYGFNDTHIQPKLIKKIREGRVPIIIIARTLTDRAIKFIKSSQDENIIGIERCSAGSKIVSSCDEDIIIDYDIWSLSGLLDIVL